MATVLAVAAFISAARARSSATIADERTKVSEIQRVKALSAGSFAEHQRVLARAATEGIDEDEKVALLGIAPKYLAQSKKYAVDAKRLEQDFAEWQRMSGLHPAATDSVFTLEIMRAREGTAFLVHYGTPTALRHLLIDGGPPGTYKKVLKPRLMELRREGKPLRLDIAVSTQTDDSHLRGLIDLAEDLRQQKGSPPFSIGSLWSNALIPPGSHDPMEVAERDRKSLPVAVASEMGIPINAPFSRVVAAPEAGAARVTLEGGLTVTILGPRIHWFRRFADFWFEGLERRPGVSTLGPF